MFDPTAYNNLSESRKLDRLLEDLVAIGAKGSDYRKVRVETDKFDKTYLIPYTFISGVHGVNNSQKLEMAIREQMSKINFTVTTQVPTGGTVSIFQNRWEAKAWAGRWARISFKRGKIEQVEILLDFKAKPFVTFFPAQGKNRGASRKTKIACMASTAELLKETSKEMQARGIKGDVIHIFPGGCYKGRSLDGKGQILERLALKRLRQERQVVINSPITDKLTVLGKQISIPSVISCFSGLRVSVVFRYGKLQSYWFTSAEFRDLQTHRLLKILKVDSKRNKQSELPIEKVIDLYQRIQKETKASGKHLKFKVCGVAYKIEIVENRDIHYLLSQKVREAPRIIITKQLDSDGNFRAFGLSWRCNHKQASNKVATVEFRAGSFHAAKVKLADMSLSY
ncbi:MAG: hypothetical protein R3A13_06455 [Bdellovibrionota bacterium]